MLQQKENKNKAIIDKTLQADISQLGMMLKSLAHQQGAGANSQQLASKMVDLSKDTVIPTAIIFLTEKKKTEVIKKVMQWIGVAINEKLDDTYFFCGKINGTLKFDTMSLQIDLYHFDYYQPIQKLSDDKRILKIVVYDQSYLANYTNGDLAWQLLEMDHSVYLLVDVTQGSELQGLKKNIQINLPSAKYLEVAQLYTTPIKAILSDDHIKTQLQIARLKNYLKYAHRVYQLLCDDLNHTEDKLQGKSILIYKRQLAFQNNDAELSNKELGVLKSKIDNEFKQMNRYVEEKVENFDREIPEYKELIEEIISFLGFVEHKAGKYITLKISEGAIKDKTKKSGAILTTFFDTIINHANAKIKDLDNTIKSQCKEWKLNMSRIGIAGLHNTLTKEILTYNNTLPDKPYEKQISFKGIGGLVMELRTPLFMLMPFMMIFALFGALVDGEDKGNIDESILFYNNRPSIAIDRLPESRDNEYRRFINEVEGYRDPKKGVFDKEINNELVTEPQLAVKTVEVQQNYNNKISTEETLDFYFDSKKRIIYLYLNENADRNFVIKKLYDPSLKLLSIPSSTRRGFGIGGLIRGLSGLREYRYLILIGLVSLISWFIITRKGSMDTELKASKNKEKQKLNSELKQHIEKNAKQSIQKWRIKLIDELAQRQNILLKTIEKELYKNIEIKKQEKAQEGKLVQKKLATVKTEKSTLASLKSEHRKVRSKLEQLETKTKRMMHV